MDFTDINDAYAVRINPVGVPPMGGDIPPPPAISQNTDPVVILPPMTHAASSTNPVYPESVVSNAMRAQQASASHAPVAVVPAPFVDASQLVPPMVESDLGYFERMGLRRRDLMKMVILSVMVTLGISLHWFGSHYVSEWIESSDFNAKQRFAIRAAYPALVFFLLWNLKAFQ
jgi:hypothetical protein